MKKTISLILGMFLLLTGCGKSSKLIRPTDSAETQETTWSESKPQSEEEKKEEKKTDYMWYVRAAGYTAIAAGTIYLIYCVFDMCNKEPIPPHQNEEINQQVDADFFEYSESSDETYLSRLYEGEGSDNSIRNEKIALDAEGRNPNILVEYINWAAAPGKPTRLISKTGHRVKIKDEVRYRAYWEKYKRKHYPNHKFD